MLHSLQALALASLGVGSLTGGKSWHDSIQNITSKGMGNTTHWVCLHIYKTSEASKAGETSEIDLRQMC